MASHHGLQIAPDGNDKGKEMFSVRRLSGVRTTSLQYGTEMYGHKNIHFDRPVDLYFWPDPAKIPLLRVVQTKAI